MSKRALILVYPGWADCIELVINGFGACQNRCILYFSEQNDENTQKLTIENTIQPIEERE